MNPRVVVLEVAARPLYWVIMAVAAAVLLRGHNEPGGGFIGGLLAVAASTSWAVAHGSDAAMRRLPFGSPARLSAAGMLVAAVAGLPGLAQGDGYLTHLWWTLPLGWTSLDLSTVLVFDLGIFLCVWGALSGYALPLVDEGEGPGVGPKADR